MTVTIAEFLTALVNDCEMLRRYLESRSEVAEEFGLTATQIGVLLCGDNEVLKCVIAEESGESEAEKVKGGISLMVT